LYLIFFLPFFGIREYYSARYRKKPGVRGEHGILDIFLLALGGVGLTLPLVYVFSPLLDFAHYPRPAWLNIPGGFLLILGSILLWFSHHALGRNWTAGTGVTGEQEMVDTGIYRWLRHPMYTAHILWALGTVFLLPNWLAGLAFLPGALLIPWTRISQEEARLVQRFGDAYGDYRKKTPALFPRLSGRIS